MSGQIKMTKCKLRRILRKSLKCYIGKPYQDNMKLQIVKLLENMYFRDLNK